MTSDDKPRSPRPEPESGQAKRTAEEQPADTPANDGEPDEGLRPDQLTTENDGGAQG